MRNHQQVRLTRTLPKLKSLTCHPHYLGIFLGSGNGAQQLYMHTLENPSQPVYGTDGRSQSAVSGGVSAALLAGAHPAGTQVLSLVLSPSFQVCCARVVAATLSVI